MLLLKPLPGVFFPFLFWDKSEYQSCGDGDGDGDKMVCHNYVLWKGPSGADKNLKNEKFRKEENQLWNENIDTGETSQTNTPLLLWQF